MVPLGGVKRLQSANGAARPYRFQPLRSDMPAVPPSIAASPTYAPSTTALAPATAPVPISLSRTAPGIAASAHTATTGGRASPTLRNSDAMATSAPASASHAGQGPSRSRPRTAAYRPPAVSTTNGD